MPRYRDDDDDRDDRRRRDDDRDRDDDRPRRRRDYDDAPPKKGGGVGMVLLIVGLVVGIPLLVCGGIVWYVVSQVQKGFNEVAGSLESRAAAITFLDALERDDVTAAYTAHTTTDFRNGVTQAQFEALVKANPVLTRTNNHNTANVFPTPVGTAPNRKVTFTFTISAFGGADPEPFDPPGTAPGTMKRPPATKKDPFPAPGGPAPKPVTCTITVAEQPGNTWKVDGFTIP